VKRIAIAACAVLLLAGIGFSAYKASAWGDEAGRFPLSLLEISGNVVLTEEEVVELAGIEPGMDLLSIDLGRVEAAVISSPRIERAYVARLLPDHVLIRLDEKLPAAIVPFGSSGFVEIADDGSVLPVAERTAFVDIPLISGLGEPPSGGEVFDSENLRTALSLLRTARELSPSLWMEISEVHIAPGSGLVIYTVADGAEIRFGSGACDRMELSQLWAVLSDLRTRGVTAETIDMRFRSQIVVRTAGGGSRGRA
jgi:cell division protein FtsQ